MRGLLGGKGERMTPGPTRSCCPTPDLGRLILARLSPEKPPYCIRSCDQVDEPWVKLTTRIFLQLLEGSRQAHSSPIRSIRGHRVNRIGDHDDSSADGDVFACQPVRIARSIIILVMMPNHHLN